MDVLILKAFWAAKDYGVRSLALCGGVACNSSLRAKLSDAAQKQAIPLYVAPPRYCSDNAAMIAGLGSQLLRAGIRHDLSIDAVPRIKNLGLFPVIR